jgi:multidrug efflux pump subunit AcrA (membrane-fusion protein)
VEAARVALREAENAPVPAPRSARERSPGSRTTEWSTVTKTIEVRASTTGTVTQVNARTGAAVTRGQSLAQIQGASERHFRAIGASDTLRGLRPGATARLRLDAGPPAAGGRVYPARVSAVSPIDGGRHTRVEVTVSALPTTEAEPAGIIELTLPATKQTILVPQAAIHRTGQGATVWIARDSGGAGNKIAWTAHRRAVQLGSTHGGKVEVRGGLTAG